MIVEDQPLLARELEFVLGDSGCDVVGCAMDRAAAIAIADREHPDLALIDVNLLDGVTGPGLARRLVRDGTAVVFLTTNPEQIPTGFSGALGAISKPVNEQTVRAVVDFARQIILHRAVAKPPRCFYPAPSPAEAAPH
jgi:DNA-binding response OmpR family regulator